MSENMLFCLGEGINESKGIGYQQNNMVFNKQVTSDEFKRVEKSLPEIKLAIAAWIKKEDMTGDEKESISGWSEMGGYLKTLGYEEAWAKWWSEAKQADKNKILNCEYFDATVFKGITGIDIKDFSLKGKEVEVIINNKHYKAILQ